MTGYRTVHVDGVLLTFRTPKIDRVAFFLKAVINPHTHDLRGIKREIQAGESRYTVLRLLTKINLDEWVPSAFFTTSRTAERLRPERRNPPRLRTEKPRRVLTRN